MIMNCAWCGEDFNMPDKELHRQLKNGRIEFYCSISCGASASNAKRPNKRQKVEKTCPMCNTVFTTLSGSKSATYCSRECASRGSVTDYRRNRARETRMANQAMLADTNTMANLLKKREAWKYESLKAFLEFQDEPHEFEYVIADYIYDLALLNRRILVEFDGKDHQSIEQTKTDARKEEVALQNGWKIIRIPVQMSSIIKPDLLYQVLREA